ncbi:MAG: hypothetical protein HPM95_03290 [Alphaproteobacteria bacterium]|nr:hypothetical protein [Alphaproteobacteria bacterium]
MVRHLVGCAALIVAALTGAATASGWPERLSGHGGPVKSVVLSPDERRALTTSFDYSVILWDLFDGEARLAKRLIGHDAAANDARFLPDGTKAVSVGDDGAVLLWDLADGSVLSRVDTGDDKMLSLAVSATGRHVAVASWDRSAHLFEVRGEALVSAGRLTGHRNNVNAVAFPRTRKRFSPDRRTGSFAPFPPRRCAAQEVHVHGWGINVLRLLEGGEEIAFGATDGTVAVVDIASGEVAKRLASHDRPVLALAQDRDGGLLASGGGDGQIRVYDARARSFSNATESYGPVWAWR